MRTIVFAASALALALGAGLFFVKDSGVRGKIAVDAAVKKIDEFLGPLEIRRQKVATGIEEAESQIKEMNKENISLGIRSKNLNDQIEGMTKSLKEMDQKLVKLRGILERPVDSSQVVVASGKKYTKSEIEAITTDLILKREEHKRAIDSLQGASDLLSKTASDLDKKIKVAERKVELLTSKLATIDAQIAALKTIKLANPNPVGDDKSFVESLNTLEAEADQLIADVEAELQVEQEEWNKATTEKVTVAADKLLQDLEGPVDTTQKTIQKIDAILGDRSTTTEQSTSK